MNRVWIRRVAIALGVLLLVLVIAAAALLATFDASRTKALAIDWMRTERQRTLAIDGAIELSLFPRLALKVSKLRLSEHARADEFLAIDEAALAVELLPLLRKQVVIDRVSARGVRALYTRDAKGARNIDDLLGPAETTPRPTAPRADTTGGASVRFDVSTVRLEDLQLRVRDAIAKVDGDITVQSFSSGRLADRAESPLSLRATLQLRQPQALKLALDGDTTLALDLERGAFALRAMKLDVQLDGAAAHDVALHATGALAWDGTALRAGPLNLALKQAHFGATALAASTIEVRQLLFDTGGQRLELDALKVALAGRQGTDMPFVLSLDWPQLAVDARSLKGSALSGQLKTSGPVSLTGSFQSGAPGGRFEALRLPGLALTVQGSLPSRTVDAVLRSDLVLNAGRGAAALEPLDLKATLTEPGLQPLQLAVRGKANADAKSAGWTIDGSLNANRFESSGQAAFGSGVPAVRAQARFDSLDLNRLLAADKPGAAPAAAGPAPADSPVNLDGLNAVNGQFTVAAGALAFRQYRVNDVKLDAALDNGLLRIPRLAGRAWGGRVDASGSAEARSHRVVVKLAADGVDVNALLKNVAGKDLLEGTGRVNADLQTAGATVGALRSALAGTVALQVRDGAVKGINLARTLRQAKAALAMKTDAISQASASEKTDFSELSASARIANGVATSDDLDVKSPFLRIGGAGQFDIGRGTIDYTARATVIGSPTGQDSADLAALKGVTVPVHLSGPFDAIGWKVQWSGVAAKAIENQLKQRLSERLGLTPVPAPGGAAASAASAPPASDKDKLREQLKRLLR